MGGVLEVNPFVVLFHEIIYKQKFNAVQCSQIRSSKFQKQNPYEKKNKTFECKHDEVEMKEM